MRYVIRRWTEEDAPALVPLVYDYLQSTFDDGGDLLPSRENVERFVRMGVAAAAKGDPTLLAESDGQLLGFHLCFDVDLGFETREKVLQSAAGYVIPEARDGEISQHLMSMSLSIAKDRGYTRLDGSVLTEANYKKMKRLGYETRGLMLIWRIK